MRNVWPLILCSALTWTASVASAQTSASTRSFQIVTSNLPPPEIGVEYKAEIRVVGGRQPYIWTVLQQSLPLGLTLDSTRGVIFGTPQSDAQFSALIQVSDSSEPSLTITKLLVSNPGPLLAIRWTDRPHISADHMGGALRVKNGSKDDVDLTVIVVAVNEYGKAFALRYEHLALPRGAETPDLQFDSSLPLGQYTLHADAVGEVAAKNAIYRDRRELPGFVVQSQ